MSSPPRLLSSALLLSASTVLGQSATQNVTVPAGVPLRVTLDQRVPIAKPGESVSAHLASPVYVRDRLVLPQGARVEGKVLSVHPAPHAEHVSMLLRGDFTPPHQLQIEFDKLLLAGGQQFAIQTSDARPSGQLVRMAGPAQKKQSLWNRLKSKLKEKKETTLAPVTAPGKVQRVKDALWLSLPYHPQWIPSGTAMDADLATPLSLSMPAQPEPNLEQVGAALPPKTDVRARLVTGLTSASDRQGAPVEAVLTDPVFDDHGHLLFPEGTMLNGSVLRAKPAKWFGRNGQLRFTFRSMNLPGDVSRPVHGQLIATEADSHAHLKVDEEGGTEAQPAGNRYLAPLTLALLASTAQSNDDGGGGQGFLAGGFGLLGRILVLASRSNAISSGFAYYSLSQSVSKRWIARGQDVVFPKDTRMDIEMGAR